MLTKPRLKLFEVRTLGQKLKFAMLNSMFGMVPAAIHVMSPSTKLDRSSWPASMRGTARQRCLWGQGEREAFAAFVSYLNHCKF